MASETRPDFANGKICYIEIPATDIDVSSAFYRDAFDWTIRKPAVEPGLFVYIMVADIEKSVQAVRQNGGVIVQQIDRTTPNVTAKFRDPAGNILGIFEEPTLASKS